MAKRDRDILIRFFVTSEEKAVIQKRMQLVGIKNMSNYLRKLAMDGYLINVDYTYIKEIVRGESYIEISEEEAESLDQAVYQEMYDPDVQDAIKPQ